MIETHLMYTLQKLGRFQFPRPGGFERSYSTKNKTQLIFTVPEELLLIPARPRDELLGCRAQFYSWKTFLWTILCDSFIRNI